MPKNPDPIPHDDVLIVGAGLSGIGAAYRLQQRCPGLGFTILEAREHLGGTWDLFNYPGIRSDSDVATFGFPFRPFPGDRALADGPSIKRYLNQVATESGIDRAIEYRTRMLSASWCSRKARWTVVCERTRPDGSTETTTRTCWFLFGCTGYYRYDHGRRPAFPDEDRFAGQIVHPQTWPKELDHRGLRIVVIGSGATAVTLVPALAETAQHVVMLQRSPTWMLSLPGRDGIAAGLQRVLPPMAAYRLVRAKNLAVSTAFYQFCRRWPTAAGRVLGSRVAQVIGTEQMQQHFSPSYPPWDQRLCVMPDGDLLQSVKEGMASVVTDHIDRFVPEGIRLKSGRVLEADLIVTATGLELLALGGAAVTVDEEAVVPSERFAYRGMMLSGVPNLAVSVGYANASWTLRSDLIARYVCRLLNFMTDQGLATATPQTPPGPGRRPLIDLSSTYLQGALDVFPAQSTSAPWQVHQNYPLEWWQTRRAPVTEAMTFTSWGRLDQQSGCVPDHVPISVRSTGDPIE